MTAVSPPEWRGLNSGPAVTSMSDDTTGRLDIGVVRIVQASASVYVDDLLAKLATHTSMALLPSRRQTLIDRTVIALLRIITEESQSVDGER